MWAWDQLRLGGAIWGELRDVFVQTAGQGWGARASRWRHSALTGTSEFGGNFRKVRRAAGVHPTRHTGQRQEG